MPHIHTEPGQHDHTVSFFIIRTDFDEPKVMYHVHRKTGKLTMFGGHVELNETPWEAALHEIVEESGYAHEQLQILQPAQRLSFLTDAVVHPQPVVNSTGQYPGVVPHYHTDTMYALLASGEPLGAPEEGESTDIRLYTLEEIAAIPSSMIFEAWREVGQYILSTIHRTWEPLPLTTFN
jgi:8-oxo-dGTP pyrophosphatase MutT (NUDIX family)